MLNQKCQILITYKRLSAILLCSGAFASFGGVAQSQNLNAGAVLDKMNTDQQTGYISGVVEGLAYSRFLRDRPSEDNMICVQNWFYERDNRKEILAELFQLFEDYRDFPVAVLVNSLAKKECGE